ncbi:RNA polymerase sigma factor [Compostibacter hankyongensis]|uniref:Sigma-70 family RNA polymerase sigma factor n=1 Tax=Compostibacter hankyongensis TaxID=1007089 RepID=A0ABP8FPA5_9BACT
MIPADHNLRIILEGCKREQRASQKELYNRFYGYGMSICMRYARHYEDALEILNDGFLKVFRGLPRFSYPEDENRLPSSLVTWIRKIMIHTAIDYYRSARHHAQEHEYELQEGKEAVYEQGDPLNRMTYAELIGVVQQLSPAYRAVFNLFVIDGFSHEEVAAILGISVGTSKSNLSKARLHLRHLLKNTHEEIAAKYER